MGSGRPTSALVAAGQLLLAARLVAFKLGALAGTETLDQGSCSAPTSCSAPMHKTYAMTAPHLNEVRSFALGVQGGVVRSPLLGAGITKPAASLAQLQAMCEGARHTRQGLPGMCTMYGLLGWPGSTGKKVAAGTPELRTIPAVQPTPCGWGRCISERQSFCLPMR